MKKYILFLLVFTLAFAGKNPEDQIATPDEVLYDLKPMRNNAFTYGERLTYRIHYGVLNGGSCYFEVGDQPVMVNDRQTYHLKVHGKSTGMVDMMFNVKDEFESYMDVEALVPWKATKKVKEGKYTDSDFMVFDHRRRIVSSRKGNMSIPEGTKDIISSIYFARSLDMANAQPGDVFPVTFYLDHKNYEFRFKFLGRETIEVDAGKFKALKVRPQVIQGRIFKDSEAITMWVTDDENKVPLLVKSDIWVGSLQAEIREMKGLKNPMTAKIK